VDRQRNIFAPCNRIPLARRAPAIKSSRATYTIARFESSKPLQSRYSFDDVRPPARSLARSLARPEIPSLKDESIHGEAGVTVAKGNTSMRPNGTAACTLFLVPSIDSALLSVSSIRSLPSAPRPLSLLDNRVHARRSIENCLSSLSATSN